MANTLEKRGPTSLAPTARREDLPEPLAEIALSNHGYWPRVWRSVVWQTGEYVKKDFLYSVIAALFMGALTLLDGSASWSTLYWSAIAFMVVFAARVGQHAVSTPSLLDSGLKRELAASEKRFAELTEHKLTFEVDQRGSSLTKIRTEQNKDGSSVRIVLDLQLRFDNKDTDPIFMRGLQASFHRGGILNVRPARDITTFFALLQATSNGVPVELKYFKDGMQIAGRQVTDFYVIKMMIAIEGDEEIRGVKDLDTPDYIKVTMKAGGHQPDLTARLIPYWEGAARTEGTTQIYIFDVETLRRDYLRLDDFTPSQ